MAPDGEVPESYSGEDIPIRQLWVPRASLELLHTWLADVTPARSLDVSVFLSDFGAVLLGPPDEGWLHAIALRAVTDGFSSLTIDGASLCGVTPFYAFTERRPGAAQRTLWFDPLRGVSDSEADMERLLERYRGAVTDFETFILEGYRPDGLIGSFTVRDEGLVEFEPWKPYEPPPPSVFERGALFLVALLPMALTWVMHENLERPQTLGAALSPASLICMISALLVLFELQTPGGRVIPWPLRLVWFMGTPLAFSSLWYSLGCTP
jgi:hypothetical protein